MTPDAIPHSVLSIVLDHSTPAIRRKMTTSVISPYMYTAPPCVYKRGRRFLSSASGLFSTLSTTHKSTHALLSPDIGTCLNQPSRDLGASLPLSPYLYPLLQAPPVQDSTVPSHTPLLDVRPRGRNQNKPVRYSVASCINHLGLGTRSIITSWCRTAGSGHR